MDDLISRQAAIDELRKSRFLVDAMEKVIKLPSAQPEIIRCKDCKHRDTENGLCEGRGWPMQLVPDDGYCDKGEREKNEDN
jgi:hypothetical protein